MRTFQRVSRFIRPSVAMPMLALLALGGLTVLVLGCGQTRENPAAAAPAINPKLPDVPVPFGFKFDTGKSYDKVTSGFRDVKHLYEGDTPVPQVAEFYRLHMPQYGWTLKEESFVGARQRFTFQKAAESCYVSVWDDWGTKVLVQVLTGTATPPAATLAPPKAPATKKP